MPEHPFREELVESVAENHAVSPDRLDDAAARLQRHLEAEGGYEFSTRHSFGWTGEEALYLYGSARSWPTFAHELELGEAAVPLCELHRRAMLSSAGADGRRDRVAEMLSGDNDPIVVLEQGAAEREPTFGLEV